MRRARPDPKTSRSSRTWVSCAPPVFALAVEQTANSPKNSSLSRIFAAKCKLRQIFTGARGPLRRCFTKGFLLAAQERAGFDLTGAKKLGGRDFFPIRELGAQHFDAPA